MFANVFLLTAQSAGRSEPVFASLVFVGLGCTFSGISVASIRRGRISVGRRGRGAIYTRERDPLNFWGFVVWFGSFGVLFLGIGLVGLIRLM